MRKLKAFMSGAAVGVLGGLIGLGGAEFRLPLLIVVFRYNIVHAIAINLVVSLATVIASFFFRAPLISFDEVAAQWIVNILAGSLLGSYAGVHLLTRASERVLYRTVVVLLVVLSLALMTHEWLLSGEAVLVSTPVQIALGFVAGIGIGIVSSLLGVAGGELIIPTIVLLYGVDIKLAGSLSLAISIPTILMALWRYHGHQKLAQVLTERDFIVSMALGSVAGAFAGSALLPFASSSFLHVLLGLILLLSALRLWRSHSRSTAQFPATR